MIPRFFTLFFVFYCSTLVASLPPRAQRYVVPTFTVHFKPVDGKESIDLQLDKQRDMTWFDLLAGVAYVLKEDHKVDIPIEFLSVYGLQLTYREASNLYDGPEAQLMKCVPHGMNIISITTTEYNNDLMRKKISGAFDKKFGDLRE